VRACSKGSEDSDTHKDQRYVRARLLPLLEAAGLDLLLSGHSHSYERSVLMHGHHEDNTTWVSSVHGVDTGRGDPRGGGAPYTKPPGLTPRGGFVAAVVGSSGKTQDAPGGGFAHPAHVPFDGGRRALLECGSLVVDVDAAAGQLDARFVNEEGQVRDHFRIVKR
jgi:hypothetical protein